MNNSCKLVYQQQTYSIIYNNVEYTLNMVEDDEWTNYELLDDDGVEVEDEELCEALMELFHEM